MSNPQEFTIQVPSEDPKKKKDKPESDKPDFKGLSKVGKDVKGGKAEEEGEELVRCNLYA